ncbi:hypothetical protein T439DRAFT_329233 [Meredithblackwellia eburnea MCA 4105]
MPSVMVSQSPEALTGWQKFVKKIECPIDEGADYTNDTWTNRDLIPIPPERRTYKVWSFFIYWMISGACISAYSTGSSLLAYGLTAQQAMACVVVGGIITGLLSVASGWMGENHHIGFTVASRYTWGLRGSYFPVILRVFTSIWWFGIQGYWGGQSCRVTLGALIPGFAHMKNTIPLSSHITTNDLIGCLIWWLLYIPLVMVPPEHLQKPFIVSSMCFMATLVGLIIWSVTNAGGGGPLFHTVNTAQSTSWSMAFGITSILSSWGSGTIGQSDWTRYANRKGAPTLSQLVAAPLTITLCCLVGVVVTSASYKILGTLYWSPITLLAAMQEHYHSDSKIRVAVFFGGLGCTLSQLSINVVLNSVSTGMDMAGLWPKMINIRRGAYILATVGIICNPWQILSSATTFLTGLLPDGQCFAVFADYLVLRKRTLKIQDLYIGNSSSIYWYYHGFHWRAFLAWAISTWPSMPGFVMLVQDSTTSNGWTKFFNISFLVGIGLGFFTFLAICLISPLPHLGEGLNYLDDTIVFGSTAGTAGTAASIDSGAKVIDDDTKAV